MNDCLRMNLLISIDFAIRVIWAPNFLKGESSEATSDDLNLN